MPLSEDLTRFAGAVTNVRVLRISRRAYSGHVHNLQTGTGWYLANGILTHNCRCTRLPKTKTWRELGIDIDEPEDLLPDSRAWFDGLSDAGQQRVMGGARRWRLYRDGQVEWGDLAALRTNRGWRASYIPTPVAALSA